MTAGSARAQFAERTRDWGLEFSEFVNTAGEWVTTLLAVCIGIFVIGMPIFLIVADHVSALNILSGP